MNVDLLLSKALKKLRENEFEEAIKILDEAMEVDPNFGKAYFWKGECYSSMLLDELGWSDEIISAFLPDINQDDWRLKVAVESYEKAMELLPEDRNVLDGVLFFFSFGPGNLLDWKILDNILGKWLQHNPEADISTWAERAENVDSEYSRDILRGQANNVQVIPIDEDDIRIHSIKYHKKIVDLIESTYKCGDFCYEDVDEKTTKVLEYPDKMMEEHRVIFNHSLTELYERYAAERDYVSFLEYFWKEYHRDIFICPNNRKRFENKLWVIRHLSGIIISHSNRKKPREESREKIKKQRGDMRLLSKKLGLTPEQAERKNLQDILVDACVHQIKGFLRTTMKDRYGETWWKDAIPEKVKTKASGRKRDYENRQPDKPRQHEFDYVDIRDFYKIIRKNMGIFKENFGSLKFIESEIISPLADFRNIVKHNGGLLEDMEIKKLETILEKIEKCTS